ncbi:MAG: ABC transporter substrate-binding protein [Spirochaetaceae bacterium]|jgi:peptide/nickel transport system substrate-binding protein|nr:ABC transporter substrate-binding protein [Spirochaetaceae bacterium]
MRRYGKAVLAAALALAVSGYLPAGGNRAKSGAGGAGGAAKNEVIIGFSSIPAHYDPLQGFGTNGQLIFSTLVETDVAMNIVPDLARAYTVSADALTLTFTIRADARFTDGTQVKASDVAFTYNTIKQNATSIDLSVMQSCTVSGNDTVVIKLTKPQSVFMLTVTQIGIVPEHLYNADFGLHPVGSGPFKLVQHDVDQQFILEANTGYYRTVPAIKRVVFLKMADEDTRLMAARSGQVDITMTSAVTAAVTKIPGYRLLREASVDNMGIAMPVVPVAGNVTADGYPIGNNVTADSAVRKALAYGLDRRQLCDDALNGFASPAYSENDGMPWWNPESVIQTDVAYAKSLLDKAGWIDADGDGIREKNGTRASFPLLYFAGDSVRQAVAMSAANQAKAQLGIEIRVEGVGSSDLLPRMFSEPMILAWGSSNPRTSYLLFHSSNAGRNDWYNPENFRNTTVDRYLDQALNAVSIEASIPFWRQAQWDGSTGTSMKGEAPYVFLINKDHLYWVRTGLNTGKQKIHAHGDAWPLVANLRDWKWE